MDVTIEVCFFSQRMFSVRMVPVCFMRSATRTMRADASRNAKSSRGFGRGPNIEAGDLAGDCLIVDHANAKLNG